MQQVEGIIEVRQTNMTVTPEDARNIAATCLRICGVDQQTIAGLSSLDR